MKKKILVIDDDSDFIDVYTAKLQAAGYDARGEKDAEEARWVIRDFVPDLVILDLNMPGISGFELMVSLPREIGDRPLPIIVFTGREVSTDEQESYRLGANSFFIKNRDDAALMRKIKEILG